MMGYRNRKVQSSMKKCGIVLKLHFLCTARFPCHKVNGQDENYVSCRCVFSVGGAVIGLRHGLSIRQEAGWLTGRKLYLLEYQAVVIFF